MDHSLNRLWSPADTEQPPLPETSNTHTLKGTRSWLMLRSRPQLTLISLFVAQSLRKTARSFLLEPREAVRTPILIVPRDKSERVNRVVR